MFKIDKRLAGMYDSLYYFISNYWDYYYDDDFNEQIHD